MRRGLHPASARMAGIQQHACANLLIKGEQSGHLRSKPPKVQANPKVELQQAHQVSDRRQSQPEFLPKFRRVIFGLGCARPRAATPVREDSFADA